MNSLSDNTDTVFSRDFRDDEKSEGVRQPDSRVQNLPASVSSSELSSTQMGGPLAGGVLIANIVPSGRPSLSLLFDESAVAVESAEDVPSVQREASFAQSTVTTAMVDVVPSGFLSISSKALLRRFGQEGTMQTSTGSVGSFGSASSASGLRVDGHPPKHSMNILDRALLRRFPDSLATLLSKYETTAVILSLAKLQKRFRRKGRDLLARGVLSRRDLSHGSLECLQKTVKSPDFPSSSLSLASVPVTALSDFALLYYTLVKDDALPIGYLQDFLSLEGPARRAAKRSQVPAASISDSMASTALIQLRKKVDQRASEVVSISDQLVMAADLKPRKFVTKWQRAVYDGPTARKDAELCGARTLGSIACHFITFHRHTNGKTDP